VKRRSFLGIAALAAVLPKPAFAQPSSTRIGRKALILSGGADRGAYQAGAIQALTEIQGVKDGQPLDFDLICGTSIGALNGFMTATAQYEAMQRIWRSVIASQDVFRLKDRYDAIEEPQSGILNKLAAAIALSSGLVKNERGILDPAPVRDLLKEFADPSTLTLIPLYISTTNLTRQAHQLFVRRATSADGQAKQAVNDTLLATSAENARVVSDALLHDVLFASAAIPLLFDPIAIPRENDATTVDYYVDGGVTQNVPMDTALLCANTLNFILVDPSPAEETESYKNALEVGLGMFATMQARILAYQLRLAYALDEAQLPFTPYVVRPARELPNEGEDFSNQKELEAMWQLGFQDMVRGWASLVPPSSLPLDSTF
jgi:predicted acylesterase/phospholipase RssA